MDAVTVTVKTRAWRGGTFISCRMTILAGVGDREAVLRQVREPFKRMVQEYRVPVNFQGLLQIVSEIAKNTLDHGAEAAELCWRVWFYGRKARHAFVYVERGPGMDDFAGQVRDRCGTSSKPESGVNWGIGLRLMLECAEGMNFPLVVFNRDMVAPVYGKVEGVPHSLRRAVSAKIAGPYGFVYAWNCG